MASISTTPTTRVSGWSLLVSFFLGGFSGLFFRSRGHSTWGAIWRAQALYWGILLVGVALNAWGSSLGWSSPWQDTRELRGATLVELALIIAILSPVGVWFWTRRQG